MSWLRNHRTTVYHIGIGIAVLVIVASTWADIGLYWQRKAIETEIVARNYVVQSVNQSRGQSGDQNDTYLLSGDIATYDDRKYRRNNYVKATLCMGVNRADEMTEEITTGSEGQADGLFLVVQDTVRNALKIFMIPRDTMIDITLTDLSDNELGKDPQHLNLAYAYGDGRERSCKYTVEVVSGLLGGLKTEWYLAADTSAISMLSDEAGGVVVTIETDGMEKQNPALIKGETVTLKGKQAEISVRLRDIHVDRSALFRMDRQQRYIKSFLETAQKGAPHDNGLVVRLFDKVRDYMVTNMTKDQYFKVVADAAGNGKLSDEDFYTVLGEGVVTPRYDKFYADKDTLTPVILELFYREFE